jgi:hypothetical protein
LLALEAPTALQALPGGWLQRQEVLGVETSSIGRSSRRAATACLCLRPGGCWNCASPAVSRVTAAEALRRYAADLPPDVVTLICCQAQGERSSRAAGSKRSTQPE